MSYVNAIMYSHAMPLPNDETDENKPLFDESKDANNPDNFKDFEGDEEIVKA